MKYLRTYLVFPFRLAAVYESISFVETSLPESVRLSSIKGGRPATVELKRVVGCNYLQGYLTHEQTPDSPETPLGP